MTHRRSSRSGRRLAVALVLVAALAVAVAPAHAGPTHDAAPVGPVSVLFDWFHGLLARLGLGPAMGGEAPAEPGALALPTGHCMDPNGVPIACPKGDPIDPVMGGELELDP